MQDKTSKNQNSNSNSEDSVKNDENLLGFSSNYKTNIYKEEEIEEDMRQSQNQSELNKLNKKLSLDSTSISFSQENNINQLREDLDPLDLNGFQRKMSSPLFDYLKGSDIYLSQIHQRTIDIRHSHNFVRKDNFFKANKSINMNTNQNNNDDSKNKKEMKYNEIIDLKKTANINNNIHKSNKNIIKNNNNCNNNYIKNNNFLFINNNYPQQIFNINCINLNDFNNDPGINTNHFNKRKMTYNIEPALIQNYFNTLFFTYNEEPNNIPGNIHKLNKKNYINAKNKKKPFDKRKGDWYCPKCNNLNFAFRINCNRCKMPKPNNINEDED